MDTRRGVDIVVSSLAMPLLAFATAALWATMHESPFFRQERMGLAGNHFTILKFRTMNKDESLPPAARITRIGRILRSIGADELPQILSILKGDMSLIGPRPTPLDENNMARVYAGTEKWDLRYQIKPGLVPPSLVYEKLEGKGYTDPEARLATDMAYIEKRKSGHALKEDVRLIWAAVRVVATRRVDSQARIPAPSLSPVSSIQLHN